MSYTPVINLVDLIEEFQCSYPKTISMFWMMKKLYPVEIRPVNGTNYYNDTVREIATALRGACPDIRVGLKRIIVTMENVNTLRMANLINEDMIVQSV